MQLLVTALFVKLIVVDGLLFDFTENIRLENDWKSCHAPAVLYFP